MRIIQIKTNNKDNNYPILIGSGILNVLPKKIKSLCPKTKKIALIIDKNVPRKFIYKLRKVLKRYQVFIYYFNSSEKSKSLSSINNLLEKLLKNNINRSDLIIGVGGGILGDVTGFLASILKRGVNFINIPTTLLSQVDSSIGGKTGVNSKFGKNLIGSFFQPKIVIIDVEFLDSLPNREIICGYAEILKHAVIKDKKFFNWLKLNTKKIFKKNKKYLIYAINKSCKIKLHFVDKDLNEKYLRMNLNYGHTFAHAIEAKNSYSKKINHGEAVLIGMVLAAKLSYEKKLCSQKTLSELIQIYKSNNLNFKLNKYFKNKDISQILNYMTNDKKNDDEKINFILLKNIGKTTTPGKYKFPVKMVKKFLLKTI